MNQVDVIVDSFQVDYSTFIHEMSTGHGDPQPVD